MAPFLFHITTMAQVATHKEKGTHLTLGSERDVPYELCVVGCGNTTEKV